MLESWTGRTGVRLIEADDEEKMKCVILRKSTENKRIIFCLEFVSSRFYCVCLINVINAIQCL